MTTSEPLACIARWADEPYRSARRALLEGRSAAASGLRGVVRGVDACGVDLRGIDLRGADLRGRSFRHARLDFAQLEEIDARDADFTSASLTYVNGCKARFDRAAFPCAT